MDKFLTIPKKSKNTKSKKSKISKQIIDIKDNFNDSENIVINDFNIQNNTKIKNKNIETIPLENKDDIFTTIETYINKIINNEINYEKPFLIFQTDYSSSLIKIIKQKYNNIYNIKLIDEDYVLHKYINNFSIKKVENNVLFNFIKREEKQTVYLVQDLHILHKLDKFFIKEFITKLKISHVNNNYIPFIVMVPSFRNKQIDDIKKMGNIIHINTYNSLSYYHNNILTNIDEKQNKLDIVKNNFLFYNNIENYTIKNVRDIISNITHYYHNTHFIPCNDKTSIFLTLHENIYFIIKQILSNYRNIKKKERIHKTNKFYFSILKYITYYDYIDDNCFKNQNITLYELLYNEKNIFFINYIYDLINNENYTKKSINEIIPMNKIVFTKVLTKHTLFYSNYKLFLSISEQLYMNIQDCLYFIIFLYKTKQLIVLQTYNIDTKQINRISKLCKILFSQ